MTISQTIPPFAASFGDEGPSIVRVGEDLRIAAASRLVTVSASVDHAAAERFMNYARENRIALDHMFAAVSANGRVEAAALAVANPGRTAMIFASRIGKSLVGSTRRQTEAIGRVIDRACLAVRDDGAKIAQSLLEPRERHELEAFSRAGFRTLANLSYLQRSAVMRAAERTAAQWPPGVSIEPYGEENESDFLEALERSYEGTLDCPDLCGLRSTRDILTGHRATGVFERALWTLLRIGGRPGGVMMLNPSPPQNSLELVYLGLAPFARGRGLAVKLLTHGLHQAATRPERTISLAVDDRNTPATRLYFRAGFRRLLRRIALIRDLSAR